MPKATSPLSRRSVLLGAAAASTAIGTSLPAASAGISPRLAKLIEQRERLNAEIRRLCAARRATVLPVPDTLRIDPLQASPAFLRSRCASFYTVDVHGEACLWGTGRWWKEMNDQKRYDIAMAYVEAEDRVWAAVGVENDNKSQHLDLDIRDLEYEIAQVEASSMAELRVLARVANEQFLHGRTDCDVIPYAFVANVLRVIG